MKSIARQKSAVLAIGALLLLIGYYWWRQPLILSPFGLRTLSNQGTALVLTSLGQLAVVLTAGVDLSIGAILALTTCVAARAFEAGIPAAVTIPLAFVVGIACGAANGALVALLRLPPIIVTLATSYVFAGFSLYVLPSPGGTAPRALHSLLTGSSGWLPNSFVLVVLALVLVWGVVTRTRLGTAVYCVGDNESAAYLSGLPVVRAKLLAYGIAGFFAALAGLFLTAQTTSGDPGIGASYTLGSIAAAVLGGAALSGGRGSAIGAAAAGYVIAILIGVLFAAGISTFYLNVFQGGILMLVLLAGQLHLLRRGSWLRIVSGD